MFLYAKMLLPYLNSALSFAKKAFIVIITFFIAIQLFFFFANKNKVLFTDPGQQTKLQIYKTINNPELTKTREGKNYRYLYSTIMCTMVGEGCDSNPNSPKNGLKNNIMGFVGSAIVMPFTSMPSSGVMWVHDGLQNAGFVSHSVAAEGIGFAALQPFRELWQLFRNLIFFLLILVMIAIGFMIMFRAKINAQTVISVENALPKIVIAMILITFSYAIAGFLIDIMYIVMGIIFALFKTTTIQNTIPTLQDQTFFGGNESLWGTFINGDNNVWSVANTFYNFIPDEFRGVIDGFVTTYMFSGALAIVGRLEGNAIVGKIGLNGLLAKLAAAGKVLNPIDNIVENVKHEDQPIIGLVLALVTSIIVNIFAYSLIGSFLVTAIITLILYLSLVMIFFRVFFMFLSAYIQILLFVIFAPALLILEAIPGRSIFSTWFKGIAFNLATFPMFLLLILVSRVIMATSATGTIETSLWTPPFIGNMSAQAFKTLVAGLLLFSSPELIKGFKQMMGYKPLPLAVNFGSFFTGVTAIAGGAFGFANQYHSLKGTLLGQPVGEGLIGKDGKSGNPVLDRLFNFGRKPS